MPSPTGYDSSSDGVASGHQPKHDDAARRWYCLRCGARQGEPPWGEECPGTKSDNSGNGGCPAANEPL